MDKYAVVYFPNFDSDKVSQFRRKYDPKYHIIPPHITLLYPFSGIPENQIVRHIQSVTKKLKPFPISLKGFIKSSDDCLFLVVEKGKEKIEKIHHKLYTGKLASASQNDTPYTPHLTLGSFRSGNNQFDSVLFEKAYKELEKMSLEITTTFSSITLIKGDGISPAKIIKVFDFT